MLNLLKILRISNGNAIRTEPDSDGKRCKGEIHENSQRRTVNSGLLNFRRKSGGYGMRYRILTLIKDNVMKVMLFFKNY